MSSPVKFDAASSQSKELLLAMLTAERDARLSAEMQARFKQAGEFGAVQSSVRVS